MHYCGLRYLSYAQQYSLVYSKEKRSIMTQTITPETALHINQRFLFAESSFARIFSVPQVTAEMRRFCSNWARGEQEAPLDSLQNVDLYFRELWNQNS